ncbi:hypothetical protein PRUPE_7G150200 [Prunus persica]|uniref:Uncharacterized protein n=1 Tax=Prunus persica TaxID=3760 RepID=A0A251NBP9_PRUPE|nr:hypothetical protein PRUPE_7G150200 [Prunus persica]
MYLWHLQEKLYTTTVVPAGIANWYYGPIKFGHLYNLYTSTKPSLASTLTKQSLSDWKKKKATEINYQFTNLKTLTALPKA